jgi:hypothetical protein
MRTKLKSLHPCRNKLEIKKELKFSIQLNLFEYIYLDSVEINPFFYEGLYLKNNFGFEFLPYPSRVYKKWTRSYHEPKLLPNK